MRARPAIGQGRRTEDGRVKELRTRVAGYAVFFVGWMLSPFSWWNDVVVNLPLSYLAASGIRTLTGWNFKWLMLVCYWLSNAAGIGLMYAGGRTIFSGRRSRKAVLVTVLMLIVYSAAVICMDLMGWLKPLDAFFKAR